MGLLDGELLNFSVGYFPSCISLLGDNMEKIVLVTSSEQQKDYLSDFAERYDMLPINNQTASMALAEHQFVLDKCKSLGKWTQEDKQALQFLMNVYNVCTRYRNGGGR